MIGGRVAMVAGPLGVASGIFLVAGTQLYSAIRQMNDIQKHIELGTGELWQNGWRTFWGLDVTSEVQERYEKAIMQPQIRKIYDEKLLEQAHHFLNLLSTQKIDTYYYSEGDFIIKTIYYKKIISPQYKYAAYPPFSCPSIFFQNTGR